MSVLKGPTEGRIVPAMYSEQAWFDEGAQGCVQLNLSISGGGDLMDSGFLFGYVRAVREKSFSLSLKNLLGIFHVAT